MTRSVRFPRRGAAAIASGSVVVLALALSACSSSPSQPAASPERVTAGRRATTSLHPASTRSSTSSSSNRRTAPSTATSGRTGCRRHPRAERTTFRVRTRSGRWMPGALPRHGRRQWRWPARRAQCEARRQRGKDGRVHHRGHERQKGVRRQRQHCRQPGMLQFCDTDVMGYHTSRRSELLDLRQGFTLDDHMFEPVASWSLPTTSTGLRLVSRLLEPAPSSCKNEIRGPYTPARCRSTWTRH